MVGVARGHDCLVKQDFTVSETPTPLRVPNAYINKASRSRQNPKNHTRTLPTGTPSTSNTPPLSTICLFFHPTPFPLNSLHTMSSIDPADLTDTDEILVRTRRVTLDDEPDTLLDPEDVDRFMNSIKRTLLFQIEWEQLMSAGPKCLAKMGDCFLAVYTSSNPSLGLLDSPGSVPGLP